MKYPLTIILFSFVAHFTFAQIDGPKEITPQVLQQINAAIEKEIPTLKQKLTKKGLSADQIEFALDTFRIEQLASYRLDIDYSTMGMNVTINEKTAAYDKLLNKYYNKLLKLLQPEDKKTLVAAQKTWLAYRDAEEKLIWAMTKDEYSGGGSMQSNIGNTAYGNLVMKRTIEIFNYYEGVIKEK